MRLRGNALLKIGDCYGGVPLVALLGLQPKRALPACIGRIGLLRTAAIGDTLLLSGPLTNLRQSFPAADIVLVTGDGNAEAGALVARGRARQLQIRVDRPLQAIRRLRRERFDALIDTGAWPRFDAILTALANARFSVGFRSSRQARHFAYDATVPHSPFVHEIENFRNLVRVFGAHGDAPPSLLLDDCLSIEQIPDKPFVVFHPWSGGFRGNLKEWGTERWIQLAAALDGTVATFVVSGARADVGRSAQLVDAMRERGLSAISFAGRLSLEQLASVLTASFAVVSVNTGVMHLSAMVGAPTVALDGPTSALRWGPLGPRAISVGSSLPGCGFLNHGFEYDGHRTDCMLGITVASALRAVHDVIATTPDQGRYPLAQSRQRQP